MTDERSEKILDIEAIAAHAGNMSLHQLLALLVCDRWVVLQKAIVTGRFCFWACATSKRWGLASGLYMIIKFIVLRTA